MRRASRVCGRDARSTNGAAGNRSRPMTAERVREILDRVARPSVVVNDAGSSRLCLVTLGRAECWPRDSSRSCRGSRARSASTADPRSSTRAPLAPEHACVPAQAVDPDARGRLSPGALFFRARRDRVWSASRLTTTPSDTPFDSRASPRRRRRPRCLPPSSSLPRERFPTASASASA